MYVPNKRLFFNFLLITLIAVMVSYDVDLTPVAASETINFDKIRSLLENIRRDNITMYNDLKFLVSLGSRMTGTEQADRAAEYIADAFRSFSPNMQVFFHYFNETILVDYGSSFKLLEYPNERFKIYGLRPNLVVPVTCNFTAPIVYVQGERMADFDGVPINGSIVLMEFNTQYRWLEAAMLGAKAVIFIEPNFSFIEEYRTKYIDIPFKFPRFYMTKSDGNRLKNLILKEGNDGSLHASIWSKQKWEIRTGRNVVAIYPGATDQIYAITAYYDSYSIVPSMSPGANEALGVVALLEVARLLTRPEYKPYYTIMFIAYSGHHQMLSGARALWNDFYFGANKSIGERVIQTTHLQLPTDSEITRLTVTSILTKVWSHERVLRKLGGGVFKSAINRMVNNLNSINQALGTHYKIFPAPHADEAPFNNWGWMLFKFGGFAGIYKTWVHNFDDNEVVIRLFTRPGLSIRTIEYYYFWSPIDKIENVNWNFFLKEVETVIPLLYIDTISKDLPDYWQGFPKLTRLARMSGRVGYYNIQADNYTLVPKGNTVLVYVEAGLDSDSQRLSQFRKVVKAGLDGRWAINGVFAGYRVIQAYAIDDETGNLTYAPDLGMHKYPSAKPYFDQQHIDLGWQVVFKCSSAVLFDTIDPIDLEAGSDRSLQIVEFRSGAVPEFYGYDLWTSPAFGYTLAMAYLPIDRETVIIFKIKHLGDYPAGLILNTTKIETGEGFVFDAGTQNLFLITPLHFSRGLLAASAETLAKLEGKLPIAEEIKKKYLSILDFTETIKEEIKNYKYSEAYLHSLEAWAKAQSLYSEIRNTTLDAINSVPFFAFLLTPFSIIFISLLLSSSGLKRIMAIVTVFLAFYLIFYIVHPGFAVASNPLMLVIGIMILILILPVLGLVFLTFESSMMKLARKVKGIHIVEMSRSSAALLSIGIGIQNMRRYRLRSVLMLTTIIIVIFAITAFTSLSSLSTTIAIDSGIPPAYPGISPVTENYIKLRIFELLTGKDAKLSVVTKFYVGLATKDLEKPCWFWVTYGNRSYPFYAMMGLRPDEQFKSYLHNFLIKGRWFSEMHWQAILPDTAAEALGITNLPVQVKMENVTFTVVGIINSTMWDNWMRNMDGSPMLIPDLSAPGKFSSSSELFIVQYDDSLTCWSGIQFFALVFKNASESEVVARYLFDTFRGVDVLYNAPDMSTSFRLSPSQTITVFGWQYQVIPILISIFIILNNMMGSVYNRKKEISTYASVGLSPLHISAMFLAESLVYAVVGSVLGYAISGIIIKATPTLASISSNYGGGFVVTAIMTTMLITISSAIYPMFLAAKLVTPSLERAWKAPTKPVLDDWSIPLPFVLKEEEVEGFVSYLYEFLMQHTIGDAPFFSIRDLRYVEGDMDGQPAKELTMNMRLAPYTLGIAQYFRIILFKNRETGKWSSAIQMHRTAGKRSAWISISRTAVDQIRKQFLIWRSLSPSERARYINKNLKM